MTKSRSSRASCPKIRARAFMLDRTIMFMIDHTLMNFFLFLYFLKKRSHDYRVNGERGFLFGKEFLVIVWNVVVYTMHLYGSL